MTGNQDARHDSRMHGFGVLFPTLRKLACATLSV